MIVRPAIILMLLGISASFGEEIVPSRLEQQGQAIAEKFCAECHATTRIGRSPHPGAPAFRDLDRRLDLDSLMDRFREGIVVGHPDMPTFRLAREDARAFVLYLRSLQAP